MRWLLTTSAAVGRAELERDLAHLDASVADAPPVPLGDEQVFEVEGPRDLDTRLERGTTCVLSAYPNSDVEPYG